MPAFDLKGIRIGKYTNAEGAVSYSEFTQVGDAMNVNLELRFAEARLYAESCLAEYMKAATGGTMSIGVKYIRQEAQTVMFGAKENSKQVGEKQIKSLQLTKDSTGDYVGVTFYAPDKIDGVLKYTAVFVYKALFGPPAMAYQTKGENIGFQTPTTTGEFLPSDSDAGELLDVAICDTAEDAIAWGKAMLGEAA